MAVTVLRLATRFCPRCGNEKLLRYSQVCGSCYEAAVRGRSAFPSWKARTCRGGSLLRSSPISKWEPVWPQDWGPWL